jgi:hypothetical protein
MDEKIITLKENEYKLLLSVLEDAYEYRSSMRCNDPYPNEKRLFCDRERIEINKFLGETKYRSMEDAEELEDYLCNTDYVYYIINKIKQKTT